MISLPPNDRDLHAYVDGHLDADERRQLDTYLASHPALARQVLAWQTDAQALRAALGSQPLVDNPRLDPATLRWQLRGRRQRRLATAAVLLLTLSVGALGGWQARSASGVEPPMADAMQAYRLFAVEGILPADLKAEHPGDMQNWLNQYFHSAANLPDLQSAGFQAVSGRLMSTDQGPAAMVLYEDAQGRRISFYIRTVDPQRPLLPQGERQEGELSAQYWSGSTYNYAMVSRSDEQAVHIVRQALGRTI